MGPARGVNVARCPVGQRGPIIVAKRVTKRSKIGSTLLSVASASHTRSSSSTTSGWAVATSSTSAKSVARS